MSDSENVDYLQEGFDPWVLTVPRLRSILVTHNVQYPGTAKKPQLIDLFNDFVVPESKKYLAARARAKRSSMGITNADSQSTTSTDFSTEDFMPPPPSAPRARSPRKSTRVLKRESEDPDQVAPLRESPRKRQSRSASAQLAPASDTDTAPDNEARSVRRGRRTTPAPKLEPPEEESFFKKTPETEGVFSNDNPFQSGSSPPTAIKTPSNRRKTTGMESIRLNRTPSAGRRRTDGPSYNESDEDSVTAVSRSFEVPFDRRSRTKTPEPKPISIEPGEEFTPEEQLALDQAEHANPELALARRKPRPTSRGTSLSTPVWVLIITLLGAYAAWYRQEKVAVGYCGLGREATQLIPADIPIPEWAREFTSRFGLETIQLPDAVIPFVEPQCEPCPSHAYCYEDFTVRCEPDFILKPHPLSLSGLAPLPPTCEPDGEKVRRVQAVADKAVEELRDRRAKFECGEPTEPEAEPLDTPAIEEQELKEVLSQKRSKRMAADEFDELWVAAIGEVKAREEVQVQQEESPAEETGGTPGFPTIRLSSTSLARLSYTCAVRRSLKLGLARHRLSIGGLIFSLLSILYGRNRYFTNRALSAKVPGLVDEVLERLANQKELAFEDGDDDAFLFLPNLRDDVLRSMHRLSDRDRLWQRVRAVVEQNSNVRTGQREGRNGEVGRAWEWIGPSRPSITEGSARRRKSTRVSWGPDVKGEEVAESRPAPEVAENKAGLHRRWEESRPIY
ncbi:Man1-Src1p-C-terminal domain-containing protein [Lasiosphaeria hispida]|uniref:Man1-Src1p-C-terminal domain-containing protein n=1 Tax=Lasiosphaeria hispida TaxID=260671 RepID=A0AAJ0HU93_9PEZI|nr:Man1-Src1p-C-terminal domain-containing protein [Lasiosphaeria hispida]